MTHDELRQLCEKAIDAPWTVAKTPQGKGRNSYRVLDGNGIWVAEFDDDKASATFCAASRTALPALLDENEKLRRMLVEACALADEGWSYAGEYFRDKWENGRISALREMAKGDE